MAELTAARGVAPSDLGSYQHAVRLVLTNDLITASRPRAAALATVLRWADPMARDFAALFGYTLIATAHQVRLVRRLDTVDDTQRSVFAARSGRPFDRRRLAYLCLVLAVFQRSRIEISLADLVRAFAPTANAIEGLGFDATITEHKRAVVDVLDWLADHGALRLSDGSAENWARDTDRGDALYDIDHDICAALFRPARPIQHLPGAAGLLEADDISAKRSTQREAAARRARRLLLEHPVAYYATLDGETAAALRSTDLADNLARLTGLVVERRAEGVLLADPTGSFTDQRFPGRGGAVNRTAGLLLAKVADLLEDPDDGSALTRLPVPTADDDQRALLDRIDAGRPAGGAAEEDPALLPSRPGERADGEAADRSAPLQAPFVERTRLAGMLDDLYTDFGAASFTAQWQHDPAGLLAAALRLLDDLRLIRCLPGGALILPAAARYRNITAALPEGARRDGQGAFDLFSATEGSGVTATHRAVASLARFKPTRAGIINLWDYFDEEFAFGDGRLALRGHNGSGKTKALEVLFPFVLDGGLDARRLDPFSGENRTMKANLLYRGQDAEHGYVWMEFGRPAEATNAADLADAPEPGAHQEPRTNQETVTLVIGLTAHKNWERARPSFFITNHRMGIDFGLLSADSRPLTAKQLTAILGRDASFGDRRGAYQDAVDARLFGLGRERYTQLLDLLIALRRPLLAKDLDPVKVSGTLSAGLSPVDEDLVEQAARDFENLAAVQKQYDDLAAADAAVRAFLTQYTGYLRAHTRHQADQVTARMNAAAGHVAAIITAVHEAAAAGRQEQRAREAGESAQISVDTFGARLSALKDRDAYKDHEKLGLRRSQLEADKARLGQDQQGLAKARANVDSLQQEADAVAGRRDELGRALGRHLQALAESAAGAGLLRDGEPADTGTDLAMTAKARVTARNDDIAEVRRRLASVQESEQARKLAETELGKARQALDACDQACRVAERELAAARAEVAGQLRSWATRWAGDQPSAILDESGLDTLTDALGWVGEPDAATLTETFTTLTQPRTDTLISRREQLTSAEAQLASEQEARTADRHKIASEHDDAPPGSDLRPADRAGRPGAPLWQLVRFADGLAPEDAAGIEGALYGAGMLTAWIHPDPVLTSAAVAAAEADGYLVALPPAARPTGRTLADVLVPEDQDLVPPAVVEGVLRSVFVADEVNGRNEAGSTREPGGTAAGGAAVVTPRAQYSYGLQLGARPKAAPEYIGATARASRRRARLAELDRLIADLGRQREDLAAQRQRVLDLLADLGRAQQELPKTAPVTEALGKVTSAEGQRTGARARLAGTQETLDGAIAELDTRARRLRHAAADRGLPATAAEVDTVERAVADFERAAEALVRTRGELAGVEKDLLQRLDRVSDLTKDNDEAAELLAEAQATYVVAAEKLSVDERDGGPEYELVRDEIQDVERRLTAAKADRKSEGQRESDAHDAAVRAEERVSSGRNALAVALSELVTAAAAFEPYTQGDLRPLLEVTENASWPAAGQWPDPERVVDELVDRLMAGDEVAGEGADPEQVIREVLPGAAATALDAFAAATRAGRAVTEGVLKGTVDRMWTAYRDFETSLKSGEDGYQADLAGDAPFYVDVVTNEGRVPAASFARKIAEDVENQGILLEQRERTVLEDSLLTALAQQIHSRVLAAKDLVDQMDADTRSKPMSSGMAVGIRWVRSDKLTDQQAQVSRLLDRDAAGLGADGLAELRGLLRAMIHDHRAANPRDTYREVLGSVLDYRSWHTFELRLLQPGRPAERLTRKKHSEMSGGEKSAAIHLPLFAAANALYSSSKPDCPRLIALDEAFAGIDDTFKPELLGLTVKFDLDLFMTGHDLWVTYPTVPVIAHYDMQHDKAAHTLLTLLALWDGEQLLDASAGFAGNEELAAELLGFRPSRYVPAGMGDVLQLGSGGSGAGSGDDGGEDESDEDAGGE